VLDIQAELHELGQPYQDLYEAVADLKRRHDLHPCSVQPRDGLSLRSDGERERVQDLVSRFRKLPEDARCKLPALLNSLGQLEIVIGDLEAGLDDFQEVARLVQDPLSRAEANHNVYWAALERRDFDTALASLRRAATLDPDSFEPFPFERYEPRQVLGAGGFGVSFLCQDRVANQTVVVRVLRPDSLDRDDGTILREMHSLQELDHPALVRILAVGGAGPDESRPYIVMEHFPGQPLGEVVARHGPFSPEEWLQIAWPIARALQAIHNRGILHRSLRPGCVLVRRIRSQESGDRSQESGAGSLLTPGQERLQVKVVDTALSLRRAVIHASASNPESHLHTSLGRSVARTVAFAPPEVVGRPKGQVWVGPHSDLYSFGRLCAAGLTGRPDPDSADRILLPAEWQQLLDDLTAWTINRRPPHAGLVLDRLAQTPGADALINRIERDLHEESVAELSRQLADDPGNLAALLNRANAHFRQGDFSRAVADLTAAIALQPGDAALYRRRAQAHARAQAPEQAIADYTEALRLEPRNLEALINRGLAYSQRGDSEKAIADYTEALRQNPRDETLYYNRGNAHSARRDYDLALADYTEAIRLNPRYLWALGNRGKAHVLRGEHARALADFTRLLQLDPGNVRTLYERAATHLALGHPDRAIADYTEAIRLEPSAALYHDRGLAQARAGRLDEAVADLALALEMSPGNAALLLARGKILAELGQAEAALADLDEAVKSAPQSSNALVQRGTVLSRLGRHADAVNDFTEAIRLGGRAPEAWFARGVALAELGEYDRAIADFTEVIRLGPGPSSAQADHASVAAAQTNRGACHLRQRDLEAALADYQQALERAPGDAVTWCNRAGVHVRLGNVESALADYAEAIRLDPALAAAYASRGLLQAGRGELEAALADLDRAIRLVPDNARPYNHRGHIHAERGDRARARADFEEAVRLDPAYAAAWFNLALIRAEEGDLPGCVEALGRVIDREPNNAAALNNRGNARRQLGDISGAVEDFSAAITADPEFVLSRYNRATVLARLGEVERALEDLDEVLRRQPDDVAAYLTRGRLHMRRGVFDLAVADNQEALKRAPEDVRVLNNLAWLWATCPDAALRDPPRALECARKACGSGEDANRLDTLAAALAACGQFDEAVAVQTRAGELAGEEEKADFNVRLEMYRAGQVYVQPRPGGSDGGAE
jgi:tetratricopeptide (TPR) repeat protein